MPLTIRSVKGSNLTANEVDANFQLLRAVNALLKGPVAIADYKVVASAPHGGTITDVVTIAAPSGGTGSLYLKINNVAVTATANAVSTTENSSIPTATNVFAPGDSITVCVTAAASLQNVSVSIKYRPA